MCAKDNHMFISHYHEDEEHITGMKELLGSSYKFKNSSVMSDKFNRGQDPDCIKRYCVLELHWQKLLRLGSNEYQPGLFEDLKSHSA